MCIYVITALSVCFTCHKKKTKIIILSSHIAFKLTLNIKICWLLILLKPRDWHGKRNSKALLLSHQFIWQKIVTCSRITVLTESAFRQATQRLPEIQINHQTGWGLLKAKFLYLNINMQYRYTFSSQTFEQLKLLFSQKNYR